jgi:hypothetical protein
VATPYITLLQCKYILQRIGVETQYKILFVAKLIDFEMIVYKYEILFQLYVMMMKILIINVSKGYLFSVSFYKLRNKLTQSGTEKSMIIP